MTTLMYVGDFRLKVQADVKSNSFVTSTCIDDSTKMFTLMFRRKCSGRG